MNPRIALIVVIAATVAVFGACWSLHPAVGVIYAGTVVQIGVLLLVPVDVGGLKR